MMRREIIDDTVVYDDTGPKRKMSRQAFISYIIAFGVSLVFVIISAGMFAVHYNNSKVCTEEVRAVVIENRIVDGDSTTYAPVFEYTYNGKRYLNKSNTSSNPPAFEVGEEVDILLDPDDPMHIYTPDDKTMLFLSVVFAGFGLLGVIVTGIILVIHKIKLSKPSGELAEERYY